MSRAIRNLLSRAADEALSNDGVVPSHTMMELAAEGYDLDILDSDVSRLLSARGQ